MASLFVSANKMSTAVDFPRCPLKVNIFAMIFNSFKQVSSKLYVLTSQKNVFGFDMLMIDFNSVFANDESIGLIGQPKHNEANTMGATSAQFFAIIPTKLFASMFIFCRFCATRMVFFDNCLNVVCNWKSSLICNHNGEKMLSLD